MDSNSQHEKEFNILISDEYIKFNTRYSYTEYEAQIFVFQKQIKSYRIKFTYNPADKIKCSHRYVVKVIYSF